MAKTSLLEGPIYRSLLTLALPIVLGQFLQAAYQLIDAFWVGRLGANQVAAVAISMPVTFLVIALGIGLGMAGATLIAQYMGAKQFDKVNHVAGQTLLMVVLTSAALGLLGYWLTPSFLTLLGVEKAVFKDAQSFMHVSFIGIVFVFTFNVFQAFMRGIGEVKVPLYIVIATVALNFILDPLFIFGYGPVPAYGVTGAALATLVTQGLAALAGLYLLAKGRYAISLSLANIIPDWHYIKKAFFLGVPASVELSTRALGLIVLSFVVANFGTEIIASYGVGSNILQLVTIPAMGLSMAVSTLVGQNLGAGNVQRAQKVAIIGTVWGFLMLTLFGILAFFFAPDLVRFFVPDDDTVIAHGAEFIRTMSLTWGFIGVQLCIMSAFRASGNMVSAMVLSLLTQWVCQFPIAYILSVHTQLNERGIWIAFAITNVFIALVAIAWFARGSWKSTQLIERDKEVVTTSEEAFCEVVDRRG